MTEPTAAVGETFSKYFELTAGTDAATVQRAQRLRYEVYCREFGFEREQDCPGGLEQDIFDHQAAHCLVRHRPTGEVAGCLRLVHLNPAPGLTELPIQRHGAAALLGSPIDPASLPATERCEISRIAVSAAFRRRALEQQSPMGDSAPEVLDKPEARSFPLLAVALFMAARVMVLHRGTPHVFAMMEPRLARMLARAGLDFQRLGPLVDYHGQRAAYYIHYTPQVHQASLAPLREDISGLFRIVEAQLATQLPGLADAPGS